MKWANTFGKMAPIDFVKVGVATNFEYVKSTVCMKHKKVRHNKMRNAYSEN